MSAQAEPKSKGARAPANANNDADSMMPLLLATLGNPTISFKKMAAMDELSRTESSLEHTFRKWRQKGREIAAQNPAHAGTLGTSDAAAGITKKPRASAKEGANGRGKDPIAKASVKGEDDEEGKAKETVFFGGTNSTKKRAALQVAADRPTKKAKVRTLRFPFETKSRVTRDVA